MTPLEVDWPRARRAVSTRLRRGATSVAGTTRTLTRWGALTEAAGERRSPLVAFSGFSDEAWLWANTQGLRRTRTLRSVLPGLPSEDVQFHFTGSAGDVTLREGWSIYRLIKECYSKHSRFPLAPTTSVLEFGCGWGRITRFFLKDVAPSSLHGIDCSAEMIDLCRSTNSWATFDVVDVLPPTNTPAESVDLVYAYSVFSHLSEESHDRWLDEFQRILRPGGILIVSTRPRAFIELCAWLRSGEAAASPASHLVSAGAFVDTKAALASYDKGVYSFSYRSELDPPHFGEACISRSYVMENWNGRFQVLEYIDDRTRCEQNLIVAQKR